MTPRPALAGGASRRGSALPDLLVIVAIIGLMVAILVPMLVHARSRAAQAKCADNLRDIAVALRSYAQDHQRRLPSTRPSNGPVVIPDLSNSGKDSPDPFALAGPRPNNIPAILFLLLRTQELSPSRLICPGTQDRPDTFEDKPVRERSNFTDVQHNLSYAVQNPYANDQALRAGFKWTLDLPPDFVLLADRGPADPSPSPLPDLLHQQNSPNHERRGQNVLYADGRVEFVSTPRAGLDGDHIYLTQSNSLLDSPQSATDTILLPPRE